LKLKPLNSKAKSESKLSALTEKCIPTPVVKAPTPIIDKNIASELGLFNATDAASTIKAKLVK
jgi:hypothetical protein